jgi:hypothetical protein
MDWPLTSSMVSPLVCFLVYFGIATSFLFIGLRGSNLKTIHIMLQFTLESNLSEWRRMNVYYINECNMNVCTKISK